MKRYANLFKVVTLIISLLALALPAAAQKSQILGKKDNERLVVRSIPSIEVLAVKKFESLAKTSPDGKKRNVPLRILLKTGNWGPDAVLKNISLDLVALNSDGSRTPLKKELSTPARAGQSISVDLSLPLPTGVIAERFEVKLVAILVDRGVEQQFNASKSGKIDR